MNIEEYDNWNDLDFEETEDRKDEIDLYLSDDEIAEVETLVSIIRAQNTNDKMTISMNEYFQIVIVFTMKGVETMFSVMNAMEAIHDIQKEYLFSYESSFELIMEKEPTIYCIYEKIYR